MHGNLGVGSTAQGQGLRVSRGYSVGYGSFAVYNKCVVQYIIIIAALSLGTLLCVCGLVQCAGNVRGSGLCFGTSVQLKMQSENLIWIWVSGMLGSDQQQQGVARLCLSMMADAMVRTRCCIRPGSRTVCSSGGCPAVHFTTAVDTCM